ncbi:hypothetical protein [Amycolatopsis sp. NPDC102389]|uniref:hypothetical protein n=1 Tax=Amycolatopsis sp. NPDC102389 TaxID=3363941 RepID=UPI00382D46C0
MSTGGYQVDPQTVDRYVTEVVQPAITDMERVTGELGRTSTADWKTLLGKPLLQGGEDFTDSCRTTLKKFFDLHRELHRRQADLYNQVVAFGDAVSQASALYARNEVRATETLGAIGRELGGA